MWFRSSREILWLSYHKFKALEEGKTASSKVLTYWYVLGRLSVSRAGPCPPEVCPEPRITNKTIWASPAMCFTIWNNARYRGHGPFVSTQTVLYFLSFQFNKGLVMSTQKFKILHLFHILFPCKMQFKTLPFKNYKPCLENTWVTYLEHKNNWNCINWNSKN